MTVRARVFLLPLLLAALCALGAEKRDAQTRLKAVIQKYVEMEGQPQRGVAVEIAEFVDREQAFVTMAESEILAALKTAGIPVLAKGKPEYLVYGAVESNWSGQWAAYGAAVVVYEATLTLRVIDAREGTVLDTATAQIRKANPSPERAAQDAIKEAGAEAAKKVVEILKAKGF